MKVMKEKILCEDCISLARCISKEVIYCNVLEDFVKDPDEYTHKQLWKLIEKTLPKARFVFHERQEIY